jgi:hypothetical protein
MHRKVNLSQIDIKKVDLSHCMHAAGSSQPARILLDLAADLHIFGQKWIQLLISAPKSQRRWIGSRELHLIAPNQSIRAAKLSSLWPKMCSS